MAVSTSCSVNTDGKIDVDTNDIHYYKDSRTGLCYAIVASRKTGSPNAEGLGITCVPCSEEVKKLLE